MKKPKNYKWQKNDGIKTMSRHLRSEHGLGPEGEERSSSGGQAQLHGYASNMADTCMPFVYNRKRMITEFVSVEVLIMNISIELHYNLNIEGFLAMEEAHNDFNIKTRIVNCCKNFHLEDKIFSIFLDNAMANTKAMDFLKEDPSIKPLLGGSLMHFACCAHILNLCIQEELDELRTLLEPIRGTIRWIRAVRSTKRICKLKYEEYGLRKKVISLDTPIL
ncbi:Zinc finger BED domain-containing protein RICESLEEPER 1 [Bienertia sinuspersici]